MIFDLFSLKHFQNIEKLKTVLIRHHIHDFCPLKKNTPALKFQAAFYGETLTIMIHRSRAIRLIFNKLHYVCSV